MACLTCNLQARNCFETKSREHVDDVTNPHLSRGIPHLHTVLEVAKMEGSDFLSIWNLISKLVSFGKLQFALTQIIQVSNLGMPKCF